MPPCLPCLQIISVSPAYSSPSAKPQSWSFPGFLEAYYNSPSAVDPNLYGSPLEAPTAHRISDPSSPPLFNSFKFTAGVLVRYTALVRLQYSGVWAVRVGTLANLASVSAFVNGQQVREESKACRGAEKPYFTHTTHTKTFHPGSNQVPLDATTGTGLVLVSTVGWFEFELRIGAPAPGLQYSLRLKAPQESAFSSGYNYGFLASGGDPTLAPSAGLPDYAPRGLVLSDAWQVR
jgi:hypothetical protein